MGIRARTLTRAELGIRVCSSSCKDKAHQIPATPLSSSSCKGGWDAQASPQDATETPG